MSFVRRIFVTVVAPRDASHAFFLKAFHAGMLFNLLDSAAG
jgi:hypothetical protein